MGQKLPPKQLELYQRLDEILWVDWDPIGVSGVAEARDEYYSYLPRVFHLALENADAKRIAEYLFSIETEAMGLSGNMKHCVEIAELILRTKDKLGV